MYRLEYNSSNQVNRLPKEFMGAEQPLTDATLFLEAL